ncbi:ComE operon protein 1 [compost metagenome]
MIRLLILALCVLGLGGAAVTAQESKPPADVAAAAPVNLNTATVAQLETLPGIGKATAERILEYRQKNGGFKKIEDLMNVRGIGEKSFLRLKPLVTITTPKATP